MVYTLAYESTHTATLQHRNTANTHHTQTTVGDSITLVGNDAHYVTFSALHTLGGSVQIFNNNGLGNVTIAKVSVVPGHVLVTNNPILHRVDLGACIRRVPALCVRACVRAYAVLVEGACVRRGCALRVCARARVCQRMRVSPQNLLRCQQRATAASPLVCLAPFSFAPLHLPPDPGLPPVGRHGFAVWRQQCRGVRTICCV